MTIVLFLLVVLLTFLVYTQRKKSVLPLLPGPPKLPIIGYLFNTSQLYDRRGKSFFSSCLFFYNFLQFSISLGYDFAVAAIQFAYASYLFDIYLPTHLQNYDHGQWPRKASPDLARILHMSSTSRKPSYSLRFNPPKLSSTQTSPRTEPTFF